jgi:hypothetical protein
MNTIEISKFEIGIVGIESEFNWLINKYLNNIDQYSRDKFFEEIIYDEFHNFFERWELTDIKFRLVFHEDKIEFIPLRMIDKLAIRGILK